MVQVDQICLVIPQTYSRPLVGKLVWSGAAVALIVVAALLTYLAGGTKTPLPHLFYLPVVIGAGAFGIRGGLIAAVASGLVCGPWMPLDAVAGRAQPTSGWLIRLAFFVAIGMLVGYGRNRLVEMARARQDFLAVVSHELRTPLASVVGFASMLSENSDGLNDGERREFAQLVFREATELSNIVDQYVVEGRLKDSALFVDSQPIDIRRVADSVIEGLPDHIRTGRVHINGVDVTCKADPLRVYQILRSMVNNALASTPDRLLIDISADKRHGELTITDTTAADSVVAQSQGRPVESTMAKPSRTTQTSLGMGLAVSRDLAKRMGGELHYNVSGMTELKLRLPLQKTGVR